MNQNIVLEAAGPSLTELNEKLDLLSAQVRFLAEQAQIAERQRQERAELMSDVMRIGNEAFALAVEQFEEVQEYVDLSDLLRLLKRLLRNGPAFEKLLNQLESIMDLVDTISPMGDEAFSKAVDVLQAAEYKGYFGFARGGMKIADNVVASFTQEDVEKLGDNVVLMLNTVKDMTQPEILGLVRAIVAQSEVEVAKPVKTSLPALIGQMRDPNVRRGLALTMRMLSVVGAQGNNGK